MAYGEIYLNGSNVFSQVGRRLLKFTTVYRAILQSLMELALTLKALTFTKSLLISLTIFTIRFLYEPVLFFHVC